MLIAAMGCSGMRPSNLGVRNGHLADCPSSPNCVSSQSRDHSHYLAPVAIQANHAEIWDRLVVVIRRMPGSRIIQLEPNYLYAEFTSSLWKFVDDVEFYLDQNAKLLHFRSASRIGYSDMGVNRKRIETIINQLAQ